MRIFRWPSTTKSQVHETSRNANSSQIGDTDKLEHADLSASTRSVRTILLGRCLLECCVGLCAKRWLPRCLLGVHGLPRTSHVWHCFWTCCLSVYRKGRVLAKAWRVSSACHAAACAGHGDTEQKCSLHLS